MHVPQKKHDMRILPRGKTNALEVGRAGERSQVGRTNIVNEGRPTSPADAGLPSSCGSHRRTPASGRCRSSVTPSMPEKTAMPSVRRISAPAPCANTSGTTPRMNANDVMMIGRKRAWAASTVAVEQGRPLVLPVAGEFDDQDRVLARQPDQNDEADLHEDVQIHRRRDKSPPGRTADTSAPPGSPTTAATSSRTAPPAPETPAPPRRRTP